VSYDTEPRRPSQPCERVFDVIEDSPDRLLELPGIGPKRKERVTASAGPARRATR
jgi:hypothetical protein